MHESARMARPPTVSVVLPTHNRASVLARSIRSVLAQTYTNLELIVVDDASTDNSAEVVAEFDDPRVIYHRLPENSGAAVARNVGAQIAQGSFLAFQDSDDEWLLDKLSRQLEAMQKSGAELLCCGYISMRGHGAVIAKRPNGRMQVGEWGADNIYDFFFITPTWLIARKTFNELDGFDESMPNLEDWEMSFRLFKEKRKIVAVDELLMLKHSDGKDSLNWRAEPRILSMQRLIEQHGDIWSQHPPSGARLYDELGRLQLRIGDVDNGRSNLWHAICLHPVPGKRWLHLLASLTSMSIYYRLLRNS